MTENQEYGFDGDVEDTGLREHREATARVETAEVGVVRTNAVIEELRGLVAGIQTMHDENHYVPKLRLIFRGGIHA